MVLAHTKRKPTKMLKIGGVLMMLISLSTASSGPSRVLVAPESSIAVAGSTLLLPCVAYSYSDDESALSPSWKKGDVSLQNDSRVMVHETVQMTRGRGGLTLVKSVLELCSVEVEDSGVYSCVVNGREEEQDTSTFQIVILPTHVPVEVTVASINEDLSEHSSVFLSCVGFGLPLPQVTWSRNGLQLSEGTPSTTIHNDVIKRNILGAVFVRSTLEICHVQRELIGEYTCTVSNGITSSNYTFTVSAPVPAELVSGPPPTNTLHLKQNYNYTCDFLGYPPPDVVWTRNNRNIISSGRFYVHNFQVNENGLQVTRSVLEIHTAVENIEGTFNCSAYNNFTGLPSFRSFTIDVVIPPRVAVAPTELVVVSNFQQTAFVSCVAFGSPRPSLVWRNGGRVLVNSTHVSIVETTEIRRGTELVRSRLEVCDPRGQPETEYSCTAVNTVTSDSSSFHICTIDEVEFIVIPGNQTPLRGKDLFLPCVALSLQPDSNTSVSWRRRRSGSLGSGGDSEELTNATERVSVYHTEERRENGFVLLKSILQLGCLEVKDSGSYSCHIANAAINKATEFLIDVKVPPFLKEEDSNHFRNREIGSQVAFTCAAGGLPHPQISWFKDMTRLDPMDNKRLMIKYEIVNSEPDPEHREITVSSTLNITELRKEDGGMYVCRADNGFGEVAESQPFKLKVTDEPATGGLSEELNHGDYVGGLPTTVLLLVVIVIHLVFRELRESEIGIPLLNLCFALVALNVTYTISLVLAFRPGIAPGGCGFLAALFHYFFLAGSFAFAVMVTFVLTDRTQWNRTKKVVFYLILFLANWGLPFLILVFSAAPDVTNYTSGLMTFCGPKKWPLWLGLALPVVLVHLATGMTLLLLPFLSERIRDYVKYREAWGIGITMFLFDLMWGVGLSSSELESGNSEHTALRAVFIMTSAVHGLVFILFFCVLSKKVRKQFIKLFSNCKKPRPEQMPTAAANSTCIGEEGLGLRDYSYTHMERSDSVEYSNGSVYAPQHRRMSSGSGSGSEGPTSPGADSVQRYQVHFRLHPIHEVTKLMSSEKD